MIKIYCDFCEKEINIKENKKTFILNMYFEGHKKCIKKAEKFIKKIEPKFDEEIKEIKDKYKKQLGELFK